jgi:hypothetical protein
MFSWAKNASSVDGYATRMKQGENDEMTAFKDKWRSSVSFFSSLQRPGNGKACDRRIFRFESMEACAGSDTLPGFKLARQLARY